MIKNKTCISIGSMRESYQFYVMLFYIDLSFIQ